MRFIHPAAWIGLLIHCFLVYMLRESLSALLEMPEFAAEFPQDIGAIRDAFETIIPFLMFLVVGQAIAIALIANRIPGGIILACATAALMLPAAFLYITGCLISHNTVKYAAFPALRSAPSDAQYVFPQMRVRALFIATISTALCGLFLTFIALAHIGVLVVGSSCFLLYLFKRAKRHPALSLYFNHIAVTPTLFARQIFLHFNEITEAELTENETIIFTVRTESGELPLTWSLQTVQPESRREALERLAVALESHRIPMT